MTRLPRNAAYIEEGQKRFFAGSTEWPGWARSGKTAADALAAMTEYAPRYRRVAALAGIDFDPGWFEKWKLVETVAGDAGTDFGVPGRVVASDRRSLRGATAERWARLQAASWQRFDDLAKVAPASLRKGPRGGGRDRDAVRQHVEASEESYGVTIGISRELSTEKRRVEFIEMIKRGGSGEPIRGKTWTLRYAVRRITWHVLDHAWEIEDRSK